MKHLIKDLWNYSSDSFTIDMDSIEVSDELMDLLADEKQKLKPDLDFNEILSEYACDVSDDVECDEDYFIDDKEELENRDVKVIDLVNHIR